MRKDMTPIMKLADFCNYECSFCRYAKTSRAGTLMSMDVAKNTLQAVSHYNMTSGVNYAHIIFHGGEPLLWGIDNFRELCAFEKEFCSNNPGFRYYNSLQTNGSFIDESWIELFLDMDMDVGLSCDGPGDLNFHVKGEGRANIADIIRTLRRNRVRHGVLSVITNAHHNQAERYYEFLREANISSVGLCYCYDPDPRSNITVRNDILAKFLIELFDLYFYGDYELDIREFEDIILTLIGKEATSCCHKDRQQCGNHFTVLPNGEMQFCDSYRVDDASFGNIANEGIEGYLSSEGYKKTLTRLRENYSRTCQHCDIVDMCHGGCFRNDAEGGNNSFCNAYRALFSHVKMVINGFTENGRPQDERN